MNEYECIHFWESMKAKPKYKTIADLPKDFGSMSKIKVKAPDGTIGWWVSQWAKGVWLRKEKEDTQIHPIFVEDLQECFNWEIIEIEIDCDHIWVTNIPDKPSTCHKCGKRWGE